MRNPFVLMIMVCALVTGCTDSTGGTGGTTAPSTDTVPSSRATGVTYVCVGMETSKRFGSCPGCKLDSNRMHAFLRDNMGYSGTLLQSEQATRVSVVSSIKHAIADTPANGLFILYYSGHGGQEQLSGWDTSEPDGADSADEYLCLYDSYLLDDEIWKLISACKGRIFMVFDACHSQTMFRSVAGDIAKDRGLAVPLEDTMVKSRGFSLRPRAIALENNGFNMLCWSGCMEAEYSYGSSLGGVMTTAILKRWKAGIDYTTLWQLTVDDVQRDQPTQHPCCTGYGTGFTEAFR